MDQHAVGVLRRHEQMLTYMSLIQSDLRERPEFSSLHGEASVDRLSGQPWGPNAVCDSCWTLRGPHGTLEVRAYVDYTQGARLLTTVKCAGSDLPSGPVERHFGGEKESPCTLGSVMPVITEILQIVTKGRQDPFANVVLPKAP